MLVGHGDDINAVGGELVHNFSSNVHYRGCPVLLRGALQAAMLRADRWLHVYPDPSASPLAVLAAEHHSTLACGYTPRQFLFTNGATEALYLIAQCFHGQRAAIFSPTFAEYADACAIHDVAYRLLASSAFDEVGDAALVFWCNPNNPDGRTWDVGSIQACVARYPDSLFVLDESYIAFTKEQVSSLPLIGRYDNVLVVRSLTKAFGIASLRLGYVVGAEKWIARLRALKMPWSVNSMAAMAGEYIFTHHTALQFDIADLLAKKEQFTAQLAAIPWLRVLASSTHYFLVQLDHPRYTASGLKDYLMVRHGILVRDATNFQLQGVYIRLSTQDDVANQALLVALRAIPYP